MGPTKLRSEDNRYNMENEIADQLVTDRKNQEEGEEEGRREVKLFRTCNMERFKSMILYHGVFRPK